LHKSVFEFSVSCKGLFENGRNRGALSNVEIRW
jgi:hypothetical protein